MDPSFLDYGFIVYIVKSDNHNDNDDEYGRVGWGATLKSDG